MFLLLFIYVGDFLLDERGGTVDDKLECLDVQVLVLPLVDDLQVILTFYLSFFYVYCLRFKITPLGLYLSSML